MLFSVEQAFVGREEIRAPLKTPAWEAMVMRAMEGILGFEMIKSSCSVYCQHIFL